MKKRTKFIWMLMLMISLSSGSCPAAEDPEVAYVEEITYNDDGTELVERYKVGDKPQKIEVPPKPRQRDLNSIEKQEIDRLEAAFAHGEISETEYNQRKRDIYRSTFVDGDAPSDGLLNYSGTF